jgi:hypothetical protein
MLKLTPAAAAGTPIDTTGINLNMNPLLCKRNVLLRAQHYSVTAAIKALFRNCRMQMPVTSRD